MTATEHRTEPLDGDRRDPGTPVLSVTGLRKDFGAHRDGSAGSSLVAVDDVSFDIRPGESFGLVGESGSGKTTTARMILRLTEPTAGRIVLDGVELTSMRGQPLRRERRNMQMVFQNSIGSLSPRMTISDIVSEPLFAHGVGTRRERRARAAECLGLVGLGRDALDRYPHEFSGGQRQRVGIARALVLRPKLIVCDEPVSALDVSVRSQILNLLADLRDQLRLSMLFIGHDLAVVRQVCDRIGVMYLGRLVEIAATDALFERPTHPYTQVLLSSIPLPNPDVQRNKERLALVGDASVPPNPKSGCRFSGRCPYGMGAVDPEVPVLMTVDGEHAVESCRCVTSGASAAFRPH